TDTPPTLAPHSDNIPLNSKLYERVKKLYDKRDQPDLNEAQMKLLEDTHRSFVRAGAKLNEDEQERMREINGRISSLTTEFQENLLAMTKERAVLVKDKGKLDGLSEDRIAAAKEAAAEDDHTDQYLLTITNTTRVPILKKLNNRDLRERLWKASAYRGIGQNGGIDNQPIILELVKLRAEQAQLLGYPNYAAYKLDPQTAETPENALD